MSNYSQSTFFTPKDSLTPGDPLKVIKGADVDPEFSAISTAIATKVDTAGTGLLKSSTTLSLSFASLTDVTPAATDEFAFGDVSDSDNIKRATLASIAGVLAGTVTATGISDSSGVLSLDIINLTEQAALDGAADYLVMYDASAGALRRVSIDDLVGAASGAVPTSRTLTAGAGLTGGGDLSANRTFAVGAGNGITVNADDVALATSVAGAGLTYTTGVLAVGAGSGISVAANDVSVDINGLTEDSSPATGDYVATYDSSASGLKKVALSNLLGGGQSAIKSSQTARSSTTTATADPTLQFSSLPAGTYEVTVLADVTCQGAAGQGIRFGILGTNMSATGTQMYIAQAGTQDEFRVLAYANALAGFIDSAATTSAELYLRAYVTLTGTGSIEFHWAQNTSNANATEVEAGSSMWIRRIS